VGGHEEYYQYLLANAANRARERAGPALQQEQELESNEVRVSLLADVDDDTARPWAIIPTRIFTRRADESKEVPREEQAPLPACHNNSTAVRACEALALSFVDEDLALRAIPERIYARKPFASACERPPARSSLTFGKLFPAADVSSKSRRPRSRGRPQNQGGRAFRELFRPEPIVAQGQGRVDCRGRMPREHSNPKRHPQGREDQGQVCPLSLVACCKSNDETTKARRYRFLKQSEERKTYPLPGTKEKPGRWR
jgi:hypothetical protein